MRIFLISLVAFALIPIGTSPSDEIVDRLLEVPDFSHFADGQVIGIRLAPSGIAWSITFRPDGSVHAQYGSLPGDEASQPKKSVHFGALLQAVEQLKSDKRVPGTSQVAIRRKGQTSTTSFYLKDDTLFRYLIASFEDTWKQHPIGLGRFNKLLELHPIYDGPL